MQSLLEFIANSVRIGSVPASGKRERTFVLLAAVLGIAIAGLVWLSSR